MLAIIIGTHGQFAGELLKTAEMIFGSVQNAKAIHLIPGKGVEDLVQEYEDALQELDTSDGVIFLNDLFGGSPYNAACRLVMKNEQYGIVSGANLPMLIEMISEQLSDEQTDILGLMDKAVQAGRAGMHVFHASTLREIR